MIVRRVRLPAPEGRGWPYTIPAIAQAASDGGLEFRQPVTFLVGENGSGKSTLVEAIAAAYGIKPQGGQPHPEARSSTVAATPLAGDIALDYGPGQTRRRHGYFLRAETAFNLLEFVSGLNVIVPGYPQDDLRHLSHGEGFLAVFRTIFTKPGLYLMDEPEAALSFTACLQLVTTLYDIATPNLQVICATHSPILAATPGADIIELTDTGYQHTTWEQLELVHHWRRYLTDPTAYLRHITE